MLNIVIIISTDFIVKVADCLQNSCSITSVPCACFTHRETGPISQLLEARPAVGLTSTDSM